MAKTQSVKVELNAVDRASRVFQKVGKEADALRGKISGISTGLSGALSGVGAGALGGVVGGLALGGTVQSAAAFEKQLFNLTNVTSEDTAKIKKDMEGLSSTLGSVTALTEGYYQILSAGVSDAAQGMELLTTASQLAAVSGTTQAESINALTKMMAGFRGEIKNTTEAADLLLDIEEYGQSSVRELIPVIGDLAGTSEIAGIKSRELAAGLALITQTAGSTSQAATQFAALANELIKPNEQLAKLIASLGAKSGRELLEKNGLIGALSLLQQAARASGKEMANFLGSQESIKAFGALAANNFGTLSGIFEQVGTKANRTQKAFERYSETFEGIQAAGLNAAENLAVAFGEGMMPTVKAALDSLSEGMEGNRTAARELGKDLGEALSRIYAGTGALVDIWKSLPDEITGPAGYGVVGAALFGRTGAVLGLAASLIGPIQTIGRAITALNNGDLSFWDFATSNSDELKKKLADIDAKKGKSSVGGKLSNEVRTSTPTESSDRPAPPALPKLPTGYKPVTDGKKTDASKAAAKAAREEAKNLELVAEVMQELEQKTGQYGIALDYTNERIAYQASLWRTAGVPEEYIAQLSEIRRLEASTDGLDKMKLGWMEFYTESMDWGSQLSGAMTGMSDSIAGAFADMASSGSASFKELASNAAKDLSRIATKMVVVWTIQKALGWAVGELSMPNRTDAAAQANGFSSANPMMDMYAGMPAGVGHDGWGLVGSSRPSNGYRFVPSGLFADAPRFHGGTGFVKPGEYPAILKAGERVLNPAETRAYQRGGNVVNNINISPPAGYEAQEQRTPNAQGGEDVQISFIRRVVAGDMGTYGTQINRAMRTQGTRLPVMRGGG